MKRIITTIFAIMCGMACLHAQTEMPTDELPLPDSVKYVHPKFQDGRVTFKDGSSSSARFNISTLYQELLFIDNEGKVQALADNALVDRVTIGGTLYFYNKLSYLGVVEIVGDVMLCASRQLVFDDAKEGAYGMRSSNIASQSITALQESSAALQHYNPDAKYELVNEPFIYRKNRFSTPTKKVVLKAFPDKAEAIEAYLKDNNVNFSSLEDLKTLFKYLSNL